MSEGTQDVVARLRADRPVTQFDSAGRTIRFDGTPSKLESEAADIIAALSTDNTRLREALAWYGEQARLARLIHSEGDAGRHALAGDGGVRARAALSPAAPAETE